MLRCFPAERVALALIGGVCGGNTLAHRKLSDRLVFFDYFWKLTDSFCTLTYSLLVISPIFLFIIKKLTDFDISSIGISPT